MNYFFYNWFLYINNCNILKNKRKIEKKNTRKQNYHSNKIFYFSNIFLILFIIIPPHLKNNLEKKLEFIIIELSGLNIYIFFLLDIIILTLKSHL